MDEELLHRQPPHSLEAEQSVLGSVLIDSRCVADIIGIVRPEDFYLQQNREIFEAVYTMFNYSQSIDPVTVLEKMRELGFYRDNSRDYIDQTHLPTVVRHNGKTVFVKFFNALKLCFQHNITGSVDQAVFTGIVFVFGKTVPVKVVNIFIRGLQHDISGGVDIKPVAIVVYSG